MHSSHISIQLNGGISYELIERLDLEQKKKMLKDHQESC